MSLRIYLASSWRNQEAVRVMMKALREVGLEVDCFCDQEGGRVGFYIPDELAKEGQTIYDIDAITALEHPTVGDLFHVAYTEDKKWLDWCNCLIMLMPCGRSAHLEAGYIRGQDKLFLIYWLNDLVPGEFENMYQFADCMYRTEELPKMLTELIRINRRIE